MSQRSVLGLSESWSLATGMGQHGRPNVTKGIGKLCLSVIMRWKVVNHVESVRVTPDFVMSLVRLSAAKQLEPFKQPPEAERVAGYSDLVVVAPADP